MTAGRNKIALSIEKFHRHGGGAESYAVALATSLLAAGWEVHCIGQEWGGEPAGARFIQVKICRFLPTWAKMLAFAFRHRKIVTRGDYAVVLGFGNGITMNVYQSHGGVHWFTTFRKVYSEPNAFLRAIKRVLIVVSPKNWARSWIESAPFRQKNRPTLIAISDLVKNDILRAHGLADSDLELVYNGIDLNRFHASDNAQQRREIRARYGFADTDTVFLFVSFELKKKGIEPLVAALLQLRQNAGHGQARLLVVGALPFRRLQKFIDKNGLNDRVVFTGPQKSTQEFYAASDVFILPTYYDACSLSVLEAMASGLPAITTESNGIAGILHNEEDGIVISHPPEPVEIARAMATLLPAASRREMGQKALATAQGYSIQENHRRIIAYCEKAAIENPFHGNKAV